MKTRWLVGVDEAGRGPLAGPVAVGVVSVPIDFDWGLVPEVGDSKQVAPEKREAIFRRAYQLRREGVITWSVAMTSARCIDEKGIVSAIKSSMQHALKAVEAKLNTPVNSSIHGQCRVLLDGGLRAPSQFVYQETIIKGDSKEKVIGLASILAKVTRDRYMVRIASQFAPYDFSTHKGYGTRRHRVAILRHGLSSEHRKTFCRNLQT